MVIRKYAVISELRRLVYWDLRTVDRKLYATKIAFLVSFVINSFATVLKVLLGMLVLGGSLNTKVLGLDHDV